MRYIVHKRFKAKAIGGEVNLPYGTVCEESGGVIAHAGKALVFATSENAHQYFAVDEDGEGLRRGELTRSIQKTLERRDANYQARWDRVWGDARCRRFKMPEHQDYWLWNHAFFEACIDDLLYIAALVDAKVK